MKLERITSVKKQKARQKTKVHESDLCSFTDKEVYFKSLHL